MITKTVYKNGSIKYRNELGQFHNEGDEPAVIWECGEIWYCKNGGWHRLAGPAIIWPSGDVAYWIHHVEYTKEEFNNHPLVREYRVRQTFERLLK